MFQRQEVQDMIAITRVLADPRDHLALGALLRGPLVGMSENDLLDAAYNLPKREDESLAHLHIGVDTDHIKNPVLKSVLKQLNTLRNNGKYTTPYDVLSSAVDMLNIRATVKARHVKSPHRALANIDRYLEMSRPYTTRGLRAFSDEVRSLWEEAERIAEAHPDGEDQSVSIITMHSSKGLEWPVVFVINTMTEIMRSRPLVVDVSSRQISMPFFGSQPTGYSELKQISDDESHNERVRLLYVATTRARDLLVVPVHEKVTERQWATVTDLKLQDIQTMDLETFSSKMRIQRDVTLNNQDEKTFSEQTNSILSAKKLVVNKTPSRHESHASSLRITIDDLIEAEPVSDPSEFVQGSAERGIVMHKLMEEILTGELSENEEDIEKRARELIQQMIASKEDEIKDMDEHIMTKEIIQTLSLPQIVMMRDRLVPEVATYSSFENDKFEGVTFGIMDAAEISDNGTVETVIDWKSDRSPADATIELYRKQISDYMAMNGVNRGLIVFMASGKVIEVAA
jgi:exodeoxyribonuclease-5